MYLLFYGRFPLVVLCLLVSVHCSNVLPTVHILYFLLSKVHRICPFISPESIWSIPVIHKCLNKHHIVRLSPGVWSIGERQNFLWSLSISARWKMLSWKPNTFPLVVLRWLTAVHCCRVSLLTMYFLQFKFQRIWAFISPECSLTYASNSQVSAHNYINVALGFEWYDKGKAKLPQFCDKTFWSL